MKNKELFDVLSKSYLLALKTQHYHWNVVGSDFYQLHKLFDEQYHEILSCIDDIAERIRVLGEKVPSIITSVVNIDAEISGIDMINDLVSDHEDITRLLQAAIKVTDDVTSGMLEGRLQAHQKHLWFLNSIIG